MKTNLSSELDGIGSALLPGGDGDSLLRRIVPSMVYFARTTNNVKNKRGAGRNSSSSSINNNIPCH